MSLSDRNPYEVHAELEQRVAKLESELTWRTRCERAEAEVERLRQAIGEVRRMLERLAIP